MDKDLRVVLTSSLGVMLEYYNFVIYILILPFITELFFHESSALSLMQAYTVFAVGYFVRPIGGVIWGHFGDKFGRKNTFIFAIFFMTFSTFFIASIPAFGTLHFFGPLLLIFFRICQGIAFGGELPAALTFTYEHLPSRKKLFGCAAIFVGMSAGILLAIAVVSTLKNSLTHEEILIWGWRLPFLLSAFNGVLGLYIVFKFADTPDFLEVAKKGNQLKVPFFTLIRKFAPETIIGFLLNSGGTVLYSVFCLLMPIILNVSYEYPLSFCYNLNMMFIVVFIIFTFFWAWFIGKFNLQVKPIYLICTIFTGLSSFVIFYIFTIHSYIAIIIVYTLIAISFSCLNAAIPYVLSQSFPTEVRFTGISTSYNFASAVAGGFTPIVVTILMEKYNVTYSLPVLIIFASLCVSLGIVALMIRNKHGKSLYE